MTQPMVKTVIDGREIEVPRDTWALEACRQLGIEIPTLCHHPALAPYGACRLCVVEVTRAGRPPFLATACDLPIREGLQIRTDTEAVRRARRMALELLWAQAPGSPELERLARRMGLERPRFSPRSPGNRCILCGLCVRVCRDLVGAAAIGFAGRGPDRRVTTPFHAPADACIGCLACAAVCPTGAVRWTLRDGTLTLETFHTELAMVPCEVCGRPAVPEKMIAFLRARLPEHVPVPVRCPECRRAATAEAAAPAALAARHPPGDPVGTPLAGGP